MTRFLLLFVLALCTSPALAQKAAPGAPLAPSLSAAELFRTKSEGGYLTVPQPRSVSLYYDVDTAEGAFRITPSEGCQRAGLTRCSWTVAGHIEGWNEVSAMMEEVLKGRMPPASIRLNSAGGVTGGAFALANYILKNGVDTEVGEGDACLSSCVYVLTAGKRRAVHPYGLVGVHQSRVQSSSSLMVSQALEEAASTSQRVDAAWLEILLRSGVNPAVMLYASSSRPYGAENAITALPMPCLRALGVDNQGGRGEEGVDRVAKACGNEGEVLNFAPE